MYCGSVGGTAAMFVGGGRPRVPGLATRPEVCGQRPGMDAREARIYGLESGRIDDARLIKRR